MQGYGKVTEKIEVIAIDECLFGMKKEIFDKVKFDEITCDNWHFYGVDICYSASELGIKSYVIPANLWHASRGNKNKTFYNALEKMKNKYKGKRQEIKSCCIYTRMNEPIKYTAIKDTLKVNYSEFKKKIKRMLKKINNYKNKWSM